MRLDDAPNAARSAVHLRAIPTGFIALSVADEVVGEHGGVTPNQRLGVEPFPAIQVELAAHLFKARPPGFTQGYSHKSPPGMHPIGGAWLQVKLRPQVDLPRLGVVDEKFTGAFAEDLAAVDQVGAIDEL